MLAHGYSSERPGVFITHIVVSDGNLINEMAKHSHRYDNACNDNSGSFVHLTIQERDDFIEKFEIILVDDKKELQMLKRIITGT